VRFKSWTIVLCDIGVTYINKTNQENKI